MSEMALFPFSGWASLSREHGPNSLQQVRNFILQVCLDNSPISKTVYTSSILVVASSNIINSLWEALEKGL
jgi:hypothetical protein